MQLALWLGTALHNFYGGSRQVLLTVQAGLKFGTSHPHLAATLASPAGYYSTGTLGQLLYQPTALSDYFLFYRLGTLSGLDALFLASVGFYLFYTLGHLPRKRGLTPAPGRALGLVGLASCLMYVLTMAVDNLANAVFTTKTQGLFTLALRPGASILYVVLGLVLGMCSRFFQPGPQQK